MSDQPVEGEFRFELTGNGEKDLQNLIKFMGQFAGVAVTAAESLDRFNQKTNSKQLRDAATGAIQYAAALKKVAEAARNVTVPTAGGAGIDATKFAATSTLRSQFSLVSQQTKELEQSLKDQERAVNEYINGLSNTRYALLDVSRNATIASVALGAVFATPIIKYAQFSQAFASVGRTVNVFGDEMNDLEQQFVDLTTQIPESFDNLSKIGTLAGQLDIPKDSVAEFTSIVAKFSATTDVMVETAAEEFGRLAQLTKTPASEYENLASAVYQVGVTSVATEGQILEMSSQIATAGNLAGFSQQEIVALSGALASLGVQPEAARGSLQRLFNVIENGATTSTKYTEELSQITGMTVETMKSLWDDGMGGSQKVFTAFVQGLDSLDKAGTNTTNVLRDLGIYQVRDQRLLQVLANNMDVYTQSLENSNSAYSDGTALSEGYARQTDNLIDNFTRLTNTIQGILAELGEQTGGPLNELLKLLNDVAKAFLDFSRTDVGKGLANVIPVAAGLGAALLLVVAVGAKMQAAMIGMVTAAQGLKGAALGSTTNLGRLAGQLARTLVLFQRGQLTGKSFAAVLQNVNASANTASGGVGRMNAMMSRAQGGFATLGSAAKAFGSVLGGLVKTTLWLAAFSAIVYAVDQVSEAFKSAQERADDFWGSDVSGLAEAIKADTAAAEKGGKVYREIPVTMQNAGKETQNYSHTLEELAGKQTDTGKAVEDTTKKIEDQTVKIGENVAAQAAKDFSNNPQIIDSWRAQGTALENLGLDLSAYFKLLAESPDKARQYVGGIAKAYEDAFNKAHPVIEEVSTSDLDQYHEVESALRLLMDSADTYGLQIDKAAASSDIFKKALAGLGIQLEETDGDTGAADDELQKFNDRISALVSSAAAPYQVAKAFQDLGASIKENGASFDDFGTAGQENINALISAVNALRTQAGDDTQAFGESILGTMVALQQQGINTGGSLSFLGQILQETLGPEYDLNFNGEPAQKSMLAVIDQAIALAKTMIATQQTAMATALAAGDAIAYAQASSIYSTQVAKVTSLEQLRLEALASAETAQRNMNAAVDKGTTSNKKNAASVKKAARSILDWVSDLRQVIDMANEFRFGVSKAWRDVEEAQRKAMESMIQGMYGLEAAFNRVTQTSIHNDSVLSMLYDVQDQAEDAAKAVRDAVQAIQDSMAKLQDIQSQRSQLNYALMVAEMYGDTLRAAEIRAELAQLAADEAEANAKLADSQEDLADAQDSQSKSLTGNSKQAIKNRQIVRNLAKEYLDYINTLIESGASQEEINKAIAQSKADFMAQAEAMGFSAGELSSYMTIFDKTTPAVEDQTGALDDLYDSWQEYILQLIQSGASQKEVNKAIAQAKAEMEKLGKQMGLAPEEIKNYVKGFDDLKEIKDKIPKNLTVSLGADMSPADKAIAIWRSKNTGGKGASAGISVPIKTSVDAGNTKARDDYEKQMKKYADLIMGTTNMKALTEYSIQWSKWRSKWLKTFSSGGFTGAGPKYQEAGIVHKGEYVVPKQDVNQTTGLPYFMERVNQPVNFPSVIMVELSPVDRKLIADNGGDVVIELDGKTLASSVNRANTQSSFRSNA